MSRVAYDLAKHRCFCSAVLRHYKADDVFAHERASQGLRACPNIGSLREEFEAHLYYYQQLLPVLECIEVQSRPPSVEPPIGVPLSLVLSPRAHGAYNPVSHGSQSTTYLNSWVSEELPKASELPPPSSFDAPPQQPIERHPIADMSPMFPLMLPGGVPLTFNNHLEQQS